MLITLAAQAGDPLETQSGIQRHAPKIFGRLEAEGCGKDTAYIVIHPTSNFFGHYLMEPLPRRGRAILALNTRYVGNDTMLLMERAILDLGAGVRFLKESGYARVVLIGNSGGGPLVAFYQAEAESPSITTTPDGAAFTLRAEDLPAADGIVLMGAHTSRADVLAARIDPAVVDEAEPWRTDPALDMFDAKNGPPFDPDWLTAYRGAQAARLRRITAWVDACLAERADAPDGADRAFLVHRTNADPRFLDLTLDPNDRSPQSSAGDARAVNYGPNGLARFSTLRSFLSQWSPRSRADGPASLARTSVPVLNIHFAGDQGIYPSDFRRWSGARATGYEAVEFRNTPHYPQTVPGLVDRIADIVAEWNG